VENGEFEKDLYNKFLQKEFGDLKLVDFLQLLDSSPSINVTGLRAIHKLLPIVTPPSNWVTDGRAFLEDLSKNSITMSTTSDGTFFKRSRSGHNYTKTKKSKMQLWRIAGPW